MVLCRHFISFLAVVAAIRAIISERREHKKNLQRWEKEKNEMDKKVNKHLLFCIVLFMVIAAYCKFLAPHTVKMTEKRIFVLNRI